MSDTMEPTKRNRRPPAMKWRQARIPDTPEVRSMLSRLEKHLLRRSGLATGRLPIHVVIVTSMQEMLRTIESPSTTGDAGTTRSGRVR